MANKYVVVKTTNDKLQAELNQIAEQGRTVSHTQWTGGRDWVIIAEAPAGNGCPNGCDGVKTGCSECPPAEPLGNGANALAYRTAADALARARQRISEVPHGDERYIRLDVVHETFAALINHYEQQADRAADEQGWVADQERRHERVATAQAGGVNYGLLADGLPGEAMLVEPEVTWGNIRYGRYDEQRLGHEFTGWIEDVAGSWIIFLGPHGAPALYWPRRDEGGGVIGEPIRL